MKVLTLTLTLVALAAAEPPVDRSYLPPSSQYRPPVASSLSAEYGPPASESVSAEYGPPLATAPSQQYGAPVQGRPSQRRLSGSFGASTVGMLGSQRMSGVGSRDLGLSSQYGAPAMSRNSGLSTEYGLPGYNYGRAGMQEDAFAEPANYQFSYSVQDANTLSDFGHDEVRQDESARGEYRVLLPDGRKQIVSYQADENGYRPTIEYVDNSVTANSARGYNYGRGGSGAGNGGYRY